MAFVLDTAELVSSILFTAEALIKVSTTAQPPAAPRR